MQTIQCPQCSKSLGSEHIDSKVNIVTCDACGAVFSPPMGNRQESHQHKAKIDDVPIPDRFTVSHNSDNLQIQYRHNACMGIFLAIFAVIWNGVIWTVFIPGFVISGLDDFNFRGGFDWSELILPLFMIPFILVGLYVAAQALAMILNTSTVNVDHKALSIKHRPIPMPLDKKIDSQDIEQIFTKRHVTHSSNGTQISFQVHMVTRNGKSKKLISGFNDAMQALFIEQEIESFLGIENRHVPGEMQK